MKTRLLNSVFFPAIVLSLLSACGDPGPVGHVDFESEFQDTANVKTTVKEFGSEQEKEYKDLALVEKEYDVSAEDVETLVSKAETTSLEDASSKTYKGRIDFDAAATWDKADDFLNEKEKSFDLKSKKCSNVKLASDVKGLSLEFTVSKTFIIGGFFSFQSYKDECDNELKIKIKALAEADSFKYSYLHLQRASDAPLKSVEKSKTKITLLETTTLVRKLYAVKADQLREAYDKFLEEFKEEAPLVDPKDPTSERVTRNGNLTLQMDKNHTLLTDTALKLNGQKTQNDALYNWKQGVYDPASGVIRAVFTPLIFMSYEIAIRAILSPFAKLDSEPIFKAFTFSKCNNVYISTTLLGVTARIEEPKTKAEADACYDELWSFFDGRPVKFDYIRSAKISKESN